MSFEQLTRLKIPVIVYLKYRKNEHFSVLRGINKDTVLLADPSLGHISMSKYQFLDAWKTSDNEINGKILAIIPNNEKINQNLDFFQDHPKRITTLSKEQLKKLSNF